MGDIDVQVVIERLDALRHRFEDERDTNTARHEENVSSIREVLTEVRRTNGRVTTLETQHRTLADEFQAVRKRWHDFRDSIQSKLGDTTTGENRKVTMRDVYLFGCGSAMFYALAKLMKWIP